MFKDEKCCSKVTQGTVHEGVLIFTSVAMLEGISSQCTWNQELIFHCVVGFNSSIGSPDHPIPTQKNHQVLSFKKKHRCFIRKIRKNKLSLLNPNPKTQNSPSISKVHPVSSRHAWVPF